jgi:hypothetical protein
MMSIFSPPENSLSEKTRSSIRGRGLFLALVLGSASFVAFAQAPPPGEHFPPLPKPSNLKILPKDISNSDLIAIMKQYEGQLGVECGYCHAAVPGTHRLNFASDAKPEKATARLMMTMTNDLNSKYVANLPTGSDMKVSCGTCHRGHAMPEEFVPLPEKADHPQTIHRTERGE